MRIQTVIFKQAAAASIAVALIGCDNADNQPVNLPVSAEAEETISFLAVGDAGYHYSYQKEEFYEQPLRTVEAVRKAEFVEWTEEDHKPAGEFVTSPLYFHQGIGGYIDASGLYPVGAAMKAYCDVKECEFGLMTGDNIYPNGATLGADQKDDPTRFQDIFIDPYVGLGANKEDFKIYVGLGNHDWKTSREGAMAQVAFHESAEQTYMDGIFYRVVPPSTNGDVEIFVIDTEVMLAGEDVLDGILNPDGTEKMHSEIDAPEDWAKPANDAERAMAEWLEDALISSTAKWKFVLGHHPLWSSGGSKFEEAKAMRRMILPTLCKYADGYFAGHEHSLEIHSDTCEETPDGRTEKPLVQILSGAGAKQRSVHSTFKEQQDRNNQQMQAHYARGMVWGFVHMELTGDMAKATIVTTPDNGSGTANGDFEFEFERRSN